MVYNPNQPMSSTNHPANAPGSNSNPLANAPAGAIGSAPNGGYLVNTPLGVIVEHPLPIKGGGGGGGGSNNSSSNTQIMSTPTPNAVKQLLNVPDVPMSSPVPPPQVVYYPGSMAQGGGYYTNDGKYYPVLGHDVPWSPKGYQQVQGVSVDGGVGFVQPKPIRTGGGGSSTILVQPKTSIFGNILSNAATRTPTQNAFSAVKWIANTEFNAIRNFISNSNNPVIKNLKKDFDNFYYTNKVKTQTIQLDDGSYAEVPLSKVSKLEDYKSKFTSFYRNRIQDLADKGIIPKSSNLYKAAFNLQSPQDIVANRVVTLAPLLAAGGAAVEAEALNLARAARIAKYGTAILHPSTYTSVGDLIYSKIPQTNNNALAFSKGGLFGYTTTARFPTFGLAYGSQFAQNLILNPEETLSNVKQSFQQQPYEMAGLLVGGLKGTQNLVEMGVRRATGTPYYRIIQTSDPSIKIIQTNKYGNIAYVEGTFSQSEKLAIVKQLEMSYRPNRVVFTQGGPEGVPLGKLGKGSGFTVIAASKPMRGLYEAPPIAFLKQLRDNMGAESGVLSHYLNAAGRDRILPSPGDIADLLLGKADLGSKRPSVLLRRSQYPKTSQWIADLGNSLNSGKGIPSNAKAIIDKYYQKFLNEPLEWKGKIYTGQEKLDLIQRTNLKGMGSGAKLKSFAALLQYSKETGTKLVGGAEVISGIKPYGPESQIVIPEGTKYFRRNIKDLRQAKPMSRMERITNFLTGIKRGQAFAKVNGNLLEFEYVRTYNRGQRVTAKNMVKTSVDNMNDALVKTSAAARREAPRRVGNPQLSLVNLRNGRVNRINNQLVRTPGRREENRRVPTRQVLRRTQERNNRRPIDRVTRLIASPRNIREVRRPVTNRGGRGVPTRPSINRFLVSEKIKREHQYKKVTPTKVIKRRGYRQEPSVTQVAFNLVSPKRRLSENSGFEISF